MVFVVSFLSWVGEPLSNAGYHWWVFHTWLGALLDPVYLTKLNSYNHCLLSDLEPITILQFFSCSCFGDIIFIFEIVYVFCSLSFGYSSVTTLWLKWCLEGWGIWAWFTVPHSIVLNDGQFNPIVCKYRQFFLPLFKPYNFYPVLLSCFTS